MVKTLRNLAVVFAAATVGVSAMAQSEILKDSYTGTLSVQTKMADEDPVSLNDATVSIAIAKTSNPSSVTFTLDNLILSIPDGNGSVDEKGVGKIVVNDLIVDYKNSLKNEVELDFSDDINIQEGSLGNVVWIGPDLGEIPVTVKGNADLNGNINLTINIPNFATFESIDVKFVKSVSTAVEGVVADGAYEVYSITGALVAKGEGVVKVDALDKGVYLVKQNGKTQKIVK